MKFDKNEIFSIWVKNPPTILNFHSWRSWIRLGYKVKLFGDVSFLKTQVPLDILSKIELCDLQCFSSFTFDEDKILQQIDLWRFIYLKKYGGTWLDSDIILIKRIPQDNIVISSEHTLQSGGRKSKETYRPNIGCLRFPPNHPFIDAVVSRLQVNDNQDANPNVHQTSKMMKFIKIIKLKKWSHIYDKVVQPEVFCPIPYAFGKEIITQHWQNASVKYGLKFNYSNQKTCGWHLWENIILKKYKLDLEEDIHENSIFNRLMGQDCCLSTDAYDC
jgi:hypothetical protein